MIVKLKDVKDSLIGTTNIETPGTDAMPMYVRLTDKTERVLIYCGDGIYREINTVLITYDGQPQLVSEVSAEKV